MFGLQNKKIIGISKNIFIQAKRILIVIKTSSPSLVTETQGGCSLAQCLHRWAGAASNNCFSKKPSEVKDSAKDLEKSK